MHRAFKFRLYPTAEQEALLTQFAGATRFVYNLALEQRVRFWRQYAKATNGGRLNYVTQGREIKALRAEISWIAEAPCNALHRALADLDKAFSAFFSGQASYPTPRRKGVHDAFRLPAKEISVSKLNGKWAAVRVARSGFIKLRLSRPLAGRMVSATFRHEGEHWFVSFDCETDRKAPANNNMTVGIDRGIAQTLTLSNGEVFQAPDADHIERRINRARRKLSRCQRGSIRRGKQKARLRRLTAKAARVRRDWQHRTSTNIARRFGSVTLEDLNIPNMTAKGRSKRGLNRSILAQGWGAFAMMLGYKLEERGGALVKVPAHFTSQQCSSCGTVDRRSRESQASFVCVECGFRANADHNAAINILRRSTSAMPVEGSGYAPDESGTGRMAA